jgi:hypothetical protein
MNIPRPSPETLVPQAHVDHVRECLRRERDDHRATKGRLRAAEVRIAELQRDLQALRGEAP